MPLSSVQVDNPVQPAVVGVVTDQVQYLEELRWLFISKEKPEIQIKTFESILIDTTARPRYVATAYILKTPRCHQRPMVVVA
ncbi:MAG: hypothetical protein ABJM19_00275 [Marinobacter sp.]|uniref:hypothetical protein n=1 Tax=Marinobacter sp. TaxID=50741 RepID=UPI003299A4FC